MKGIAARLRWPPALLAVACSSAPAPAPAPPPKTAPAAQVPASTHSTPADLHDLVARLDALSAQLAEFWRSKGPDRVHGGFHGTLDRRGSPIPPTDKGLVQQARHLWTFSMLYERRGRRSDDAAVADGVYRFFVRHFRRPESGDFVFRVDARGKTLDPSLVLYAESFAIYGLVRYATAFGKPEALEHALACFRAMDRRRHDPIHGGYDERGDTPWLKPGSAKSTNTHLHLMEAFAALYEATRDPLVRARTSEIVDLFVTKIVQPDGHAQPEFDVEWRSLGAPEVSYGHDLETSWLLDEVAHAIGRREEPAIDRVIRRVGETSAAWGYDPAGGGYFETGIPNGAVAAHEKIWWVQFEALPALWQLFRTTSDRGYLDKLLGTLRWIETRQRDREYGELYWGVLPNGTLGPRGDRKGEEWKAGYHQLRAAVFVADWIKRELAR